MRTVPHCASVEDYSEKLNELIASRQPELPGADLSIGRLLQLPCFEQVDNLERTPMSLGNRRSRASVTRSYR